MPDRKIKRALISVYDKTDIIDFARTLVDRLDIEIVSTGGTAGALRENGIPVTLVEEITGFPEMMDGRVKTLHPKIHAAILADRDNPEHMRQLDQQDIGPIDMVVVNLYPFERTIADPECTFEQAIEMIDIGGPCLLRAAAKNHRGVIVLSSPEQYHPCLAALCAEGDLGATVRVELSLAAFSATCGYDRVISGFLNGQLGGGLGEPAPVTGKGSAAILPRIDLSATLKSHLRYGENPHQNAGVYGVLSQEENPLSLVHAKLLAGEMSFNNYVDANAALDLCTEVTRGFGSRAVTVFVKHTNACGVGVLDDPVEAYRRAYLGDPQAAMGGVLAHNCKVDAVLAAAVMESLGRWGKDAGAGAFFVEVWVAPEFEPEAVEIIKTTKKWGQRVRLLAVGSMSPPADASETSFRKVSGGMLVQTGDLVGLNEGEWKVVTKRGPSDVEMADLRLAWLICKHTKSNAITVCKDSRLLGNGAGQMSRVMSCRIATWLARENGHAEMLHGAVAASDAFFPFADGPDILMDAGVTAIIQPGGSKRDDDVTRACDARGVAMIHTGTRHFKH